MPQVNLPVKDMLIVSPAPRIVRPWSNVKNPYPYGCSVFCNHPKDPEQKEILWKSKPEPFLHCKRNENQGEEDETSRRDFLANLRWRVQSRFEETNSVFNPYRDSRASSAVATRSSRSLAVLLRRCVTPDAFPDNFCDRRRIVLDLRRRCRSSDGLSFTTAKTYDDDSYDVKLNASLGQPNYELTSTEIPQGTKHRTNATLRKPRPRLGPAQVSLEKEPVFQKHAPKSARPAKALVRAATIANTMRPIPRSAPSEPSRAQPSAKRRKNKKLSPQNSEERTLIEPKKKTVELVEDDFGISDVFREEEPAVLISPEPVNLLETLQNEDFLTSEGLKKLEHALRAARENVLQHEKNPVLTQRDEPPMSFRALAVEEWLRIPRFGAVYGARFQLPIDMRSLENMDTVKYLEEFVILSRPRQRLIDLVLQRWQKNEVLPLTELKAALMEITGTELTDKQNSLLQSFLDLHELDSVSKRLFAGLAAVAERTIGRQETRKDDLEEADFSDLPNTLENLELKASLRNLLLFIHQT